MTGTNGAQALVLVSYGSHGVVLLPGGERRPCKFRRRVGRPLCGDRVLVGHADDDSLVVDTILERTNFFVRADERQRQHKIAANLDQVLIVVAPRPAPSQDLVERYLLAVHSLGIKPLLVVNKTDVDIGSEKDSAGIRVLEHMPDYAGLGYSVIRTSCKAEPGVAQLEPVLRGRTSILVGQSGVGKSSLINQLLPDMEIQTGAVSASTGKGTHTTTATVLYQLPGGGFLIDSPGVWEYGIWKLTAEQLAAGFVEFAPWVGRCHFNNCVHAAEPGCAVKQAVAEGRILDWRYRSYLRLFEQNTQARRD